MPLLLNRRHNIIKIFPILNIKIDHIIKNADISHYERIDIEINTLLALVLLDQF